MDYTSFLKKIGRAIRERREELNLTQAQVADKLGTEQGNVSRLERGEQGFDSLSLFKLAGALDIPLCEIMAQVEGRVMAKSLAKDIGELAFAAGRMAKEDPKRYAAIKVLLSEPHQKPPRGN